MNHDFTELYSLIDKHRNPHWLDRIIDGQKRIQGKEVMALIRECAMIDEMFTSAEIDAFEIERLKKTKHD